MVFFERILSWAVRYGGTLRIGLIWITITVAAAIFVTLAVGRAAAPMTQEATRRPFGLALTRRQVPASIVATLALLATFIVSYIALMLAWEAFADYDDSVFKNLITLKGHNIRLWILPELGRFQPLILQEFNLVRHFTDTITGYQVVVIVQLLISAVLILLIDNKINIPVRGALLILILLTPSICASFISLPPSERPL